MNLYYGRASIDIDKFIFRKIEDALREKTGRIILLVPEQYTLQTERNAFEYLDAEGFIDLEIMSLSSLGNRILSYEGKSEHVAIDKMGRHILLSKILKEEKESFEVFGNSGKDRSFIEMTNDLITEMKQFDITPEMLWETANMLESDIILKAKLTDISNIFNKYEIAMKGKFIDSEDLLGFIAEKIKISNFITESEFWIVGFDYFTPKNLEIISAIDSNARETNIVFIGSAERSARDSDLFKLSRMVTIKLENICLNNGNELRLEEIPGEYKAEKPKALSHLEREIFAYPLYECDSTEGIELCKSSNFYTEAETIAARITQLVRDEGMRYRDIVVICNDTDIRASIIKRTFTDYGIPVFIDAKRGSAHNPCIEFILSIMEVLENNRRYSDVFVMVKTGFTPVSVDMIDDLENYCIKYNIKGSKWSKPFAYGAGTLGAEKLAALDHERKLLDGFIRAAINSFKGKNTVKEKTKALYEFLTDIAHVPSKIDEKKAGLEALGALEHAAETSRLWKVIVGLFDQMVEILGEEEQSNKDYTDLLRSGFEAIETGMLPPSNDLVMVGTLMRTRTGRVKALFVAGANDGVIPSDVSSEGLLSENEKEYLLSKQIEICKNTDVMQMEEKLAIYKTFARAERLLWVGYEAVDADGRDIRRSEIVDRLSRIFPELVIFKDIVSAEDPTALTETPYAAASHLTEALRSAADGRQIEEHWLAVYKWLNHNRKLPAGFMSGILYRRESSKLNEKEIRLLYAKEGENIGLSPSAMERYSACPFSHFVMYGLKPEERRIFEVGVREIGDVYHECLMLLSRELTMDGISVTDPRSGWMIITEEECIKRVTQLIDDLAVKYREGLLKSGAHEEYRTERMKEVCGRAAWAMISQVQAGRTQNVFFEAPFGRDCYFPEIAVQVGEGKEIRISGVIDRVDLLQGVRGDGSEEGRTTIYVKIIDYKSGNISFDLDEVKKGRRLQLMLYLKSVISGLTNDLQADIAPAGVFYFGLDSGEEDVSKVGMDRVTDAVKDASRKKYKLDGIILDDDNVIRGIGGEFTDHSDIIPVRLTASGFTGNGGKLLSEEAFQDLRSAVDKTIIRLCEELYSGNIDAEPAVDKTGVNACRYCDYKSICTYE